MANAIDVTTLANVKLMLGLAMADLSTDSVLSYLITSQSAFFLTQINRSLALQSYTETLDGRSDRIRQHVSFSPFWGGGFVGGIGTRNLGYALTLYNTPVVSITSITIDGVAVPQGSNSNQATQVDGWTLNEDRVEMIGSTYSFTPGIQNIVIVYQAGYATIPQDIDNAVVELVDYRYKQRQRRGERSKMMPQGGTVFYETDAIPPSVQAVIDQYSRISH